MEDFELVCQNNYEVYFRENGERKIQKIITTINNSKYTGDLFYQSRSRRFVPTAKDFGRAVLGNFSLSFSRPSTVKFASCFLLEKWNNEVNYDLDIAFESQLINIYKDIINHVH